MTAIGTIVALSPHDYDAVLFDLDGVLTSTAEVHAAAWKRLFDEFLQESARATGAPFVPFDDEADYRRYVDGKPRYVGVADFLRSRDIVLPPGSPTDPPGDRTVCGLGNLKNVYFHEHLRQHGANTLPGAVALAQTLREQEVKTAVVSSSRNCEAVLKAAGIAHLFDVRVDGRDIADRGLPGKPAPDTFLDAARQLRVDPHRAIVIEDAIAGVEAGKAGEFGLIIGVDHTGQSQALREAGADIVVTALEEIKVTTEPPSAWSFVYEEFDPPREKIRESLCALGNGYFETRGATPWAYADDVHYPGTYLAGGYNRLTTMIHGQPIENEDLVNLPNWLLLEFRIENGPWFDLRNVTILSFRQELDLRRDMLLRTIRFEDDRGRRCVWTERRLVSMRDMHLAAMEMTLLAENWSGSVTVRSALDGRIVNAGSKVHTLYDNKHLEPLSSSAVEEDSVLLRVQTSQSRLQVAMAARTRVYCNGDCLELPRRDVLEPGYAAQELDIHLVEGQRLIIEKLTALYTSRDQAISEPGLAACKEIRRAPRFDGVMQRHVLAWKHLWRRFEIYLQPTESPMELNVPMLLRLNILHLLQAVSPNSIGLDIGVPARGWTGETYQGHVFWDDLFIFPFLNFRVPEVTRSLLLYRYRRLNEARARAQEAGYRGAMFPWQSGSDGQEATPELNLNPRTGKFIPDMSRLQRHVGSAIVYNVWQYFQVSWDMEFLQFYGAELILEIARFWSSLTEYNEQRGRYEIRGVVGPDEYHEAYPDAATPGLNNNAYTNIMAAWALCRALDVLELLPAMRRAELIAQLDLKAEETARWEDISRRMFVPFHGDGIISQFEGYENLLELDWERYRRDYGNIQRLDLILYAEGDSPNRYKMSKQADVLMLFFLFSSQELGQLFARLGYPFNTEKIPEMVDYYDRRSAHGSTLSRVVHAWVLARSARDRAMTYFAEALQSDVGDIQQGTTAEGVHLGAMAGTVDLVQRATTGLEITGDCLRLNPQLPEELERIDMRISYRGHAIHLRLMRDALTIRSLQFTGAPIQLALRDEIYQFAGGTHVFRLQHSPAAREMELAR